MTGTSVHITNMSIEQLCSHKVGDLATALGCENFSGPSRNGPRARKKRELQLALGTSSSQILFALGKT